MSHSFLFHVSKTIPHSRINPSFLSTCNTIDSHATIPRRKFSTALKRVAPITLWGGESLVRTLRSSPSRSVFVKIRPVHVNGDMTSSEQASMLLREQDPSDIPPDDGVQGGSQHNNGDGEDGTGGGGDGMDKPPGFQSIDNQLQKPTVPEHYPQVLALPIARRPLFPGFYKAVVVKDAHVTSAIKDLLKRGQPYVGAFLLKDENADIDVISNINQIYDIGVFAQITSIFPAGRTGADDDSGLTAVLYPHRRIKATDIIAPSSSSMTKDQATQTGSKDDESSHEKSVEQEGK